MVNEDFDTVRRRLSTLLTPGAPAPTPARPLELVSRGVQDPPSMRAVEALEAPMRARAVEGPAEAGFAAFLDGAQWTRAAVWAGSIPVIHGEVAAVIRERKERRLVTWRSPIVERALYAPVPLLADETRAAIDATGLRLVDTLDRRKAESSHPFALQELAYQAVLAARERVEQSLGAQWCEQTDAMLFVDGGISGSPAMARAKCVVGVVKSHQTLHANDGDLATIVALRARERSSVVRVAANKRSSVASWYLRLRDHAGQDPFWGLVRVEIALPQTMDAGALGARADEASRWILAESLPLSVPDSRWDKMVYGIRDCEEFLRATRT
jgi:hypothetical protein